MIRLALLLALLVGCDSQPTAIPVYDLHCAEVSLAIARAQVDADTTDEGERTDECETCYGTGKTGDGITICTACDGTGKRTKNDPVGAAARRDSDSPSIPPAAAPVFDFGECCGELTDRVQQLEELLVEQVEKALAAEEPPKKQPPAQLKPKLTLRTGDGAWCAPCIKLAKSIERNDRGVADLLKQFDLKTTKYTKASGVRVPLFVCGDQSHGGPNLATLVPWLQSQLKRTVKDD